MIIDKLFKRNDRISRDNNATVDNVTELVPLLADSSVVARIARRPPSVNNMLYAAKDECQIILRNIPRIIK